MQVVTKDEFVVLGSEIMMASRAVTPPPRELPHSTRP
jgi:hypothetical protein